MEPDGSGIGKKIRNLRQRSNISLRQLARTAGVAVSYVSSIEHDMVSPTLATLRKLLLALNTNMSDFFSDKAENDGKYIFRKGSMRMASDEGREYTFVLPRREGIGIEIQDESFCWRRTPPEFERLEGDFAGYVLDGEIILEIGDEPPESLLCGDAFHVPAGTPVRGYCEKGKTARMITFLRLPESAEKNPPAQSESR